MSTRIEKGVYFVTLFSLILQTGKHFWPSFAYVQAIRVDYLAPTLYVSDICITLLVAYRVFHLLKKKQKSFLPHPLLASLFLLLFASVTLSSFRAETFYGALKILECVFFGYIVSQYTTKNTLFPMFYALFVAGWLESIVAIWQFLVQHSIGGIWYFLGERTFDASTLGIATFPVHGQEVLRSYGTFPHPNVLAFFLFTVLIMSFSLLPFEKNRDLKNMGYIGVACMSLGLLFTFSRVVFTCISVAIVILLLVRRKNMYRIFLPLIIVCIAVLSILPKVFIGRLFNFSLLGRDFLFREDLVWVAAVIFKKNPILGVGINSFYRYEGQMQKIITPIYLQPVHSIYLLILAQLGSVGLGLFIYFVVKTVMRYFQTVRQVKDGEFKSFYQGVGILFGCAVMVGFFDHFFITVQQGQLLFALVFGLMWSKRSTQVTA